MSNPLPKKRIAVARRTLLSVLLIGVFGFLTLLYSQTTKKGSDAAPPRNENPSSRPEVTPQVAATQTQAEKDLEKLQMQLSAQKEAEETIKFWIGIMTLVLIGTSLIAFSLQIGTLFADVRSRRQNKEESEKQSRRDDELHGRFLELIDVASKAAKESQDKVTRLEEGRIKRAGETLQLINSLLMITERAATKAAGAQFDFLSRTIDNLDHECKTLISEATRDDERDIIAKTTFSEEVRLLTDQINSLDHQIVIYNESVPSQFRAMQGAEGFSTSADAGAWARLSLTGPCLFIRGQNHLQQQNFTGAINDWKASLTAGNAEASRVDANYWIGYINNTLGNFQEAERFLQDAEKLAPERRRPELSRLELETRFFALDLAIVPNDLLDEGEKLYKQFHSEMQQQRLAARAISSFATTMGNMTVVERLRASIASGSDLDLSKSSEWFQRALVVAPRSRWARFGMCCNLLLSGQPLDETARSDVRDVIQSVNREYTARIEDRSKVLSKVTEYICLCMLGDEIRDDEKSRLPSIASSIQLHASLVRARTLYSQFRKQNVGTDVFLREFYHFERTKSLLETFRMANTNKQTADSS